MKPVILPTIQTTINDAGSFNGIATLAGLNAMRNWFANQAITAPEYIAWGTGTTTLSVNDTTLEGEVQRNAIGVKTVLNNIARAETLLTYSQGNGNDITKSGLLDTASLGTLWFEQKFAYIAKANTFQIDENDAITIN
jgi:hypothetical protein